MSYYGVEYGITLLVFLITILTQVFVSSSYSKYSKVKNERHITGKDAARYLLDKNHLEEVEVVEIGGYLSDHYDPSKKIVRLSRNVYNGDSVASVAVACHECGHAIQDKEGYSFMRIRARLVPFVNFASYAGYVALMLGILFGFLDLIWLGILLEVGILLFQFVTLPVEINASKRALVELDYAHFLNSQELKEGKTMLTAAALTYVASVATTFLEILRLVLLFGRRNDS